MVREIMRETIVWQPKKKSAMRTSKTAFNGFPRGTTEVQTLYLWNITLQMWYQVLSRDEDGEKFSSFLCSALKIALHHPALPSSTGGLLILSSPGSMERNIFLPNIQRDLGRDLLWLSSTALTPQFHQFSLAELKHS